MDLNGTPENWTLVIIAHIFKILLNNQTILPLFLFSKGHFVRSLQEMLGKFSSRETTLMQFQQLQMRPNIYPLKTTSWPLQSNIPLYTTKKSLPSWHAKPLYYFMEFLSTTWPGKIHAMFSRDDCCLTTTPNLKIFLCNFSFKENVNKRNKTWN